jgi:3-oxoacyl-[acyl-carrier protein] reductase
MLTFKTKIAMKRPFPGTFHNKPCYSKWIDKYRLFPEVASYFSMEVKMSSEKKTAIITGAAIGIGLAIAEKLAAQGTSVIMSDIDLERGSEAADMVADKYGVETLFIKADVSNRDDLLHLMENTAEKFGSLDMLINNAGICPVTPWDQLQEEEWDRVLDINLKGVFFGCQIAGKIMKSQGSGAIVNMASISARTARNVGAHYSASKAGVVALTRSFSMWLAPEVRVNAVAPGPIDSEMVRAMPKETRDWITAQGLLCGIGQPEDVADGVGFLLSKNAKHITGTVLDINGGQYFN